MLTLKDAPYRWFPPRLNRAVLQLARWINRFVGLPRNHRVRGVEIRGQEHLDAARDRQARLLLLPNHHTHSDPQIMMEAQRRSGVVSCFLAAYDTFLHSPTHAWVMQHCGAFSVDRDANDRTAIAESVRILVETPHALTVFPEGNVFFSGDRLMPFLEGASFIGLRAQRKLGDAAPVAVIPVSIKATHLTDVRSQVRDLLAGLADELGEPFDPDLPPVDALYHIGGAVLRRQVTLLLPDADFSGLSDPAELRAAAVEALISPLEARLDCPPRDTDGLDNRVRRVRAAVHKLRQEPETAPADAERWAEQAMLALRIASYHGDYVRERPTLDRVAESVEKLLEDARSEPRHPFAPRRFIVQWNAPVWLDDWPSGKEAMQQLTATCEQRVQAGLDAINASLDTPGAMRVDRW